MVYLIKYQYKVIQRVGEGSFSQVLKCQNKITGSIYAAKRLKRIYQSINEVMECPEIIVMKKISRHPNILYMVEFHYDPLPGKVTLIFELMNMSLYDMIKNRKGHIITEQKVKIYLYQLLRGLDHLHKHGIFHRDIKPENILVKGDVIKLADLGSIHGTYSKPPYTEYISTRWYRSPECLLTTGFYGLKMDIWAIGCVFYELLTLKPLFPGSNEIDQINKIHTVLGPPHAKLIAKFQRHKSKNCQYLFPNDGGTGFNNLLPNITEVGKELLKQMLVYDPENRSNVKRLLQHRYFNEFNENYIRRQSINYSLSSTSHESCQWHKNSVLLNYITSEKCCRCKPMNIYRSKAMVDTCCNKTRKLIIPSPINHRTKFPVNSNTTKMILSDEENSAIVVIQQAKYNMQKSWRKNIYLTKNHRNNEFPKSKINSITRLPPIKYNVTKISERTDDTAQHISSESTQIPFSHRYNMRNNNFYPNFKCNIENVSGKDIKYTLNKFLPQIIHKPEHQCMTNSISATPQENRNSGS